MTVSAKCRNLIIFLSKVTEKIRVQQQNKTHEMIKGSKEKGVNLKKLFDDNFLGEQFGTHLHP